jgi:hypothetical protein
MWRRTYGWVHVSGCDEKCWAVGVERVPGNHMADCSLLFILLIPVVAQLVVVVDAVVVDAVEGK